MKVLLSINQRVHDVVHQLRYRSPPQTTHIEIPEYDTNYNYVLAIIANFLVDLHPLVFNRQCSLSVVPLHQLTCYFSYL